MLRLHLILPVHVLQASKDNHTVGETALDQEVEGVPVWKHTTCCVIIP